jgi:hypothetical protein
MIGFEFEGVATFPVAFSFSTGAESICCVRFVSSLSHFSTVRVCLFSGGAAMGCFNRSIVPLLSLFSGQSV